MGGWDDQIRDHPVHGDLDEALALVADIDAPDERVAGLRRTREVLEFVRARLRAAEPALLSPSLLTVLQGRVAEVVTPLNQFQTSDNEAYLDQAVAPTDTLLTVVAAVPAPPPDKLSSEATDRAKELRTVAGEATKAVRLQLDELRKELDSARDEIRTAAGESDGVLEALKGHVAQLEETIEQQARRLDTAMSDFDSRTAAALEELQTTFQTAETARLEEARNKADAQIEELTTAGDEARASFESAGEAAIAGLQSLQEQAAQLVGTITSTATAGYFQKVANAEQKSADTWRIITVVTAVVVGFIGLWAVLSVRDASTGEWSNLASKAFLSSPFAAIAAYAGKQSGSHRRAERDARHRELQLAALEPFLEPLEDGAKTKVRASFAEHLFGPVAAPDNKSDGADTISATDLVQGLVAAAAQQNGAKR
jgi:hypothetical protein